MASLSPWHRLLFQGLWTLADREGRLLDRPSRIRMAVFPYDRDIETARVDAMLTDLAARGFIKRYTYLNHMKLAVSLGLASGPPQASTGRALGQPQPSPSLALGQSEAFREKAIFIPTFLLHQHPHHREPTSVIEPPLWVASDAALGQPQASPNLGTAQPDPGPAVYGVRCTESVKSTAAEDASAPLSPERNDERQTDDETYREPDETIPDARVSPPAENLRVLVRLAHELIELHGDVDPDSLKAASARRHIPYDSTVVRKAVDVARVQRRRRGPAHA